MKTILTLVLILCSAAFAQFQTFSAPGAGTGNQQGTYPQGINSKGTTAGFYVDANNHAHGFTRTSAGKITIVDAFNTKSGYTSIAGINASGQVIGNFTPIPTIQNGQSVGFLLSPGGKYSVIQAQLGQAATQPIAVNDSGVVAGFWSNFDGTGYHSFVRDAQGNMTLFDALASDNSETEAYGINATGSITGFYIDFSDSSQHGFLRDPEGNITSFDPDGSIATYAYSINTSGQIAGYYLDSKNVPHGFIRNTDGSFTTFAVPGANSLGGQGAIVEISLNDSGQTAGQATLGNGSIVAWIRRASGTILEFQVCGNSGIAGMNNVGHVTGFCGDTAQQLSYDGFTF